MDPRNLRLALFSGNYNYVRDGANQALNRLVGYLLRQGAHVRVYSPTVEHPAFPPTGDLVSVPSLPVPRRPEYRIPMALPRAVRRDLADFAPNIVQIASPDIVAHRAVSWARKRGVPAVASVHTRFETYLSYYHLQLAEPAVRAILRRLYQRCDALMVPAQSTASVLRAQHMNRNIAIWARGVDRDQFNPGRRDLEWRHAHGIADDQLVIAFLGRIVMEKGLDVFVDVHDALQAAGISHRVVVIGDGPAKAWFQGKMPDGVFVGHQTGADLARALASADLFLNPSVTEAFGNVTLEAMACALPVVAAAATGATNLVQDGVTGVLVDPFDRTAFVDAIATYAADPSLAARHGAAGLAFAETQDWDRINASVVQVYGRAIEHRERLARLKK